MFSFFLTSGSAGFLGSVSTGLFASGASAFVFTSAASSAFLPLILLHRLSALSPILTKKFLTLPINPILPASSGTALANLPLPTAIPSAM